MRNKHTFGMLVAAAALVAGGGLAGASTGATAPGGSEPPASAAGGEAVTLEPGLDFNAVLLPKFTGIAVFDQANQGAQEAAAELGTQEAEFTGPTADNSVAGQIEIVTNAATQGRNAIIMSNNAGDQIVPAVQQAVDAGVKVVTRTRRSRAVKARACSSPRSTSTRPAR